MVEGITTMIGGDITEAEEMIINQKPSVGTRLMEGGGGDEICIGFCVGFGNGRGGGGG
jgi:hypothetical protein